MITDDNKPLLKEGRSMRLRSCACTISRHTLLSYMWDRRCNTTGTADLPISVTWSHVWCQYQQASLFKLCFHANNKYLNIARAIDLSAHSICLVNRPVICVFNKT